MRIIFGKMRATQPILPAPWFQPCYAHHYFVATYPSTLLRNNGRSFGILHVYSRKLQHR